MIPRKRQSYPGVDKLKELKDSGISNVKIAHLHGVSSQTVHRWMVKAQIEGELPSDEPDEERFAKLVKAQSEQELELEQELQELDDEQNAPLATYKPNQPSQPKREPQTSFELLSKTQQRAVLVYVDRPELNNIELAAEVGVTPNAISAWKKQENFQQAFKEVMMPTFRTEALVMVIRDLKRVIDTGKARPEDRKLLSEISGLTQGDGPTVNVAIATDGYAGSRWR